jgi:hypothetical protein
MLMEMMVRSMETAETTMEIDGDGSGGTFLSRQGAGIETSIPHNSSTAAAKLQNSFSKIADSFRVFRWEASYRRRGVVRRRPGGPHHRWARPGPGPHHLMVWAASGPPLALVRYSVLFREK